jgi:hypothetical protein
MILAMDIGFSSADHVSFYASPHKQNQRQPHNFYTTKWLTRMSFGASNTSYGKKI